MEKLVVTVNPFEQRLIVKALNDLRTDLLQDDYDTGAVDDVILKVIDAKKKKDKEKDMMAL